jgi:hypothetical protein
MRARVIRSWFCVAVALIALAIADPLTEWASNRGVFGPGDFTDHSNADVLPALLVGLIFIALHLLARGRYAARASAYEAQRWFAAWSRALDMRSLARLLPFTLGLQIAALWLAETLEQFLIYGHGLGGSVWLGGPLLAALTIHLTLCAIVALASTLVIGALARTALRAARVVVALALLALREAHPIARRWAYLPTRRFSAPLVCRIGGRAPPFVPA